MRSSWFGLFRAMRKIKLTAMGFQSPLYTACPQKHALEHPQKHALRNLRNSIAKQTDVSLSLASHVISSEAKDTNIVFSPMSVQVLLCMTAAGSGGPTRDQLLGYLRSGSVEELNSLSSQVATLLFADGRAVGGPRLSFANSL